MKYLVVLLVISFINSSLCTCIGCVDLDDLTFPKVIAKFKTVLVKIDQQFPFGDLHETYSTLAREINNKSVSGVDHADVLIALVGIKDYGEMTNVQLGEKYGIMKRQDSPVIKLFIDGDVEKPINFEIGKGKVSLGRLYSFLKTHSKVHVQVPGCIKELDQLADEFVKDKTKREEILKTAEDIIAKIEDEEKKKMVKTYAVLMKGVIEKGEDFVAKQRDRMTNLLGGKITESKIEELNLKINIIGSFKFDEKIVNEEL